MIGECLIMANVIITQEDGAVRPIIVTDLDGNSISSISSRRL